MYELWYKHFLLDETVSFLIGIHDYNSEFDVAEYGSLYLNSSFGIQPDISVGGRPSVFPLAAPALRVRMTPSSQWEILMAVYDGDPEGPEADEHFPDADFSSDQGAFWADDLGIAVAQAIINDDLADSTGRDGHETTIEAYSAQIHPNFRIQPDIQYVINPGAASGVKNAAVSGIRAKVAL